MIDYTSDRILIAIPHMRIYYGAKRKNLDKVAQLAHSAKEMGSPILLLPSMFYVGPILDRIVRSRISRKSATETIPGTVTNYLSVIASRYGVIIVTGPIIERAGPKLYMTSLVIAPFKGVVSRYRKIFLGKNDENISPGHEILHIELGIKMGLLIEEDILVPEIAHILKLMGASMLIVFQRINPGYLKYRHVLISRAIENSAFVIAVGGILNFNGEDVVEIPSMLIDDEGNIVEEIKGFEERVYVVEASKERFSKLANKGRIDLQLLKNLYKYLKLIMKRSFI